MPRSAIALDLGQSTSMDRSNAPASFEEAPWFILIRTLISLGHAQPDRSSRQVGMGCDVRHPECPNRADARYRRSSSLKYPAIARDEDESRLLCALDTPKEARRPLGSSVMPTTASRRQYWCFNDPVRRRQRSCHQIVGAIDKGCRRPALSAQPDCTVRLPLLPIVPVTSNIAATVDVCLLSLLLFML
jgi:hypothetical protein